MSVAVDRHAHVNAAKSLPVARLFVGSEEATTGTGGTYKHVNPSTGEVQGVVPLAGAAEVDAAVAAAQAAFVVWGDMRPADRRRLLVRFATLVEERIDDFARIAPLENGIPLAAFRNPLGMGPVVTEWTSYYAGWADKISGTVDAGYSSHEHFEYTIAEPYGVVGHIITWNAPAVSLAMKVPASLAAGNTVVIKPSELTPWSATRWLELAQEAGIPDGVMNVVTGGPEAGDALVRHPGVAKISFTGGPPTAQRIMAVAAETLKPLVFELGGKGPSLIFDDADLGIAVAGSVGMGLGNSGQSCAASTRLLVQDRIYDEVVELVKKKMAATIPGDPLDPAFHFGPVVNDAACERIMSVISEAIDTGAGTLAFGGGRLDSPGYFIEPTLFIDIDPASNLAQREVFGPVLSMMPFSSEEEAIALANDTPYGLSSWVQTRDVRRANRIIPRLRAGTVYVNPGPGPVTCANSPFGGIGLSGMGREGGRPGLDEFLRLKGVGVSRY